MWFGVWLVYGPLAYSGPKVALSECVFLFLSLVKPTRNFGVILWNAFAIGIRHAKTPLSLRESLLSGFPVPVNRLGIVFGVNRALRIETLGLLDEFGLFCVFENPGMR